MLSSKQRTMLNIKIMKPYHSILLLYMQNRTEIWGAYGRLALGWANAFLKEEDCLILRIILSHGKLKLDVDTQVYQEAQLYMTK